MTYPDKVREARKSYLSGAMTDEQAIDLASGMALESGTTGIAEEFVTMLAYEHITGKVYVEDEWV